LDQPRYTPVSGRTLARKKGSPAQSVFTDYIGGLYSLAYTIKMTPKKMHSPPKGYFDFSVYPLEGVWDINDKAKANFNGRVNKDDFVYTLMIRQPDFVSDNFYSQMLALAMEKKKNPLLEKLTLNVYQKGNVCKCYIWAHLMTNPLALK
jgi:hypothetical protein